MRLLSNGYVVFSQHDVRVLLNVLSGSTPTSEMIGRLESFYKRDALLDVYSAGQVDSLPCLDPRLEYLKALNNEVDALKALPVESQIINMTAALMSPAGGINGRAQAIAIVREITGLDVPKAAEWLDEYYKRS